MTAIDCPPGLGLDGRPIGEFTANPRSKRLAAAAMRYAVVAMIGVVVSVRHQRDPSGVLVLGATAIALAGVGYAVRRARIAIDGDGVRWGWAAAGFRLGKGRLVRAEVYADGIAMVLRRGSWFLAARDWDRWDAMARAIERAGMPTTAIAGAAPWRARLQSYGRVLDGLMVVAILASTAALVIALASR
ncbi:MAG: hypothetical protein K8W52_06430 [Deltaproteobacteria bacterium]|nr:hypothetical protein [Deltaproteobacteria bacterium]